MIDLNGKTVMVAGGAGFVGSAVVRELLARDIAVVCYDSFLHGVFANVQGLEGPVTVVHGDVCDGLRLVQVLKEHDVQVIIDCVGDTFVPTAYEVPKRFFDINVLGTLNVLQAARSCDLERVLYVSSTEVYGVSERARLDEAAPLNPVNTYALSKLAADRLCYTFHLEHAMPVIVARIFNCYGPRETEPYVVPEIIAQLSRGNVLELGNLKAERDLTYVHDTARALIALVESDLADGEVVNVGSDNSFSVEWLAHQLAEVMGVADLVIEQDPHRLRRFDIDRFRCDNAKLKRVTGWAPTVGIEEGLRRTVDWFRAHGSCWSWESFVRGTQIYR